MSTNRVCAVSAGIDISVEKSESKGFGSERVSMECWVCALRAASAESLENSALAGEATLAANRDRIDLIGCSAFATLADAAIYPASIGRTVCADIAPQEGLEDSRVVAGIALFAESSRFGVDAVSNVCAAVDASIGGSGHSDSPDSLDGWAWGAFAPRGDYLGSGDLGLLAACDVFEEVDGFLDCVVDSGREDFQRSAV